MKKLLRNIGFVGLGILLAAGISVAVASTIPQTPSVFETYLASQQLSSDTQLTLANVTLRDGSTLTGYVCLTLDSNTSSLEYECGTVSGFNVIGLTRGLDAVSGTTSIPALEITHRRGADVKITDYPTLTILSRILGGVDTAPSVVHYAPGTVISSSDGQALVNVNLLNATAISGAPNSSETVNGISQLATGLQAASSTSIGSTLARLVIPASLSTSSPGIAGLWNVITGNDGKIQSSFLNGTTENYSFNGSTTIASSTISGNLTVQGSTTLAANSINKLTLNTVPYQLPSTQGAANTLLTNNGSGVLSWASSSYLVGTTTASTTPYNGGTEQTAESITIPANTLGTANAVSWQIPFDTWTTQAANSQIIKLYYAGTSVTLNCFSATIAFSNLTGYVSFKLIGNGSTNSQYLQATAHIASVGQLTATAVANADCVAVGTATIDSTSNQTMKMTITWNNQNGGAPTATYEAGLVSLIK